VHNDHLESSKVVDFGTSRKRVWNFLLVLSSNTGPIFSLFWDIRAFVRRKSLFPYPPIYSGHNFNVFPLE